MLRHLLALFILTFPLALLAKAPQAKAPVAASSWKYVESRLLKEGFPSSFVSEMERLYEPKDFLSVVELNVLLFLRKSDYHGPQVSRESTTNTEAFLRKYKTAFEKAETTTGVPGSVVACLLWIESRHGKSLGRFHVPSVYLSLLQANRKPVIQHLKKQAPRFGGKVTAQQLKEIEKRTKKKSSWALEELQALEKAYSWKWTSVATLRGSFSGAFGMPQFIPSSYARWARAQNGAGAPDLFSPEDSIQSVSYYLQDSGWKKNAPETHIPALMKYNNSRDYALAILSLAEKVEGRPLVPIKEPRRPAQAGVDAF